jgi:hypothetical protein
LYELVHQERELTPCLLLYPHWLDDQEIVYYQFQTRIFIKFAPTQLASMQADFTRFRNAGNQIQGAHFVPADWLGSLIQLTKRYPLAHHLLVSAQKNQTSVEGFAHDLAIGFCQEWRAIKDDFNKAATAEKILCAAVHFPHHRDPQAVPRPINISHGLVISGRRHSDCLELYRITFGTLNGPIQGFLTNTNRFVDRTEAFEIAATAGQLLPHVEISTGSLLISEQLYLD